VNITLCSAPSAIQLDDWLPQHKTRNMSYVHVAYKTERCPYYTSLFACTSSILRFQCAMQRTVSLRGNGVYISFFWTYDCSRDPIKTRRSGAQKAGFWHWNFLQLSHQHGDPSEWRARNRWKHAVTFHRNPKAKKEKENLSLAKAPTHLKWPQAHVAAH
jgi:hypothetical protein